MHGPAFGTAKSSPQEGITLNGYYVPGGTELSVQLYLCTVAIQPTMTILIVIIKLPTVAHSCDVSNATVL